MNNEYNLQLHLFGSKADLKHKKEKNKRLHITFILYLC